MELSTAKRLLSAYGNGERNFTHWQLLGADLRRTNLCFADVSGAQLKGALLAGARMEATNIDEALRREAYVGL